MKFIYLTLANLHTNTCDLHSRAGTKMLARLTRLPSHPNTKRESGDETKPRLSIVKCKSKVRNGYYFVLLRQIFIPEVSLERGKFPLQDYIHNSIFLRYRAGFHIPLGVVSPGHVNIVIG